MKIKQVDNLNLNSTSENIQGVIDTVSSSTQGTIIPEKKVQGSITNDTKTHWGDIVGQIEDQTDLVELVSSHVGKIDTEIIERKEADKVLNRRLSNLEESVPEQLAEVRQEVYDNILPKVTDVEDKLKVKSSAMYYDELCDFGTKKLWYLTDVNEILDPNVLSKDEILSHIIKDSEGNPLGYELGKGGGGGGGGGEDTEIKVYPINWPTTIAYGTTCELKINWYSTKDESPTGPGVAKVSIDGITIISRENTGQGIVSFDITEYISSMEVGTHKVEVKLTDVYNNSARSISTITTVSISLESTFNPNRVLTGSFNYTYTPNGTIEKKVYFVLDGKAIGTDIVKTSGEQQSHKFTGWTHGSHILEVYFTCVLDGNIVSSNILRYDLMYEVKGNKTPIITSIFTETSEEQETSFSIPYRVYTPNHNKSDIVLLINGVVQKELSVDQNTQYWENKITDPGDYILTIKCGTVEKSFNINIYESTVPVEPVTEDLALYLNTTGRSNAESETDRKKWEDKERGISCTLTDFNFSSDGWVQDSENNTVLRVTGDARVVIPYKPFSKDFKITGKTIELEFATSDVLDYEQNIISCLSDAPTIGKKDVYESELQDRYAAYTSKMNGSIFRTKVGDGNYGDYTFEYLNGVWTLDSKEVNLDEYGITIEIKELDPSYKPGDPYLFETDKIVVSYDMSSRGFYVTPQLAKIKSQQSELQTQYKENDHVRISFVIEKKTDTRIIYMYVNGVMCGATQYADSDDFRQLVPVNISIGSAAATIDIYNIRIYDNNLNRKQIVNNWVADTQNKVLKKQRYQHNDNYNELGELVISKLPTDLPYIIWDINPLPQYKGDKRPGNVEYVDQEDDTRNFTAQNAQYNVQGTSSAVYPVKNIRIKYKQGYYDDAKLRPWPTFKWSDKDGNKIKKYAVTSGGIKDNYFTHKVDYASSEGANNVELTKLYNDACKEIGILTPPQKLDDKVRVGIDGYPIIAFHKNTDGSIEFNTKANFNNDKANEDVYGFADGDESWEITNNSYDEAKFKKGVTADTFANAFEIRFPDEDGYSDLSKLGPMTAWVASTDPDQATNELLPEPTSFIYSEVRRSEDGTYSHVSTTSKEFLNDTPEYRLTKFKAELKDWFDVDSTVFYYIFTHLYLMIDSRAKNAFPTYFAEREPGDGGNKWFWLPYDMDTAIGINNEGKLVFDYNLEDTDQVDGSNVFNGQDSVIWNNLRKMFDGEIGEMYSTLRTTILSYDETDNRFSTHQAKWSESIFNEDSYVKYVKVLAETGANYLEMLQGSKAEQRKWWLYNRFKYFDSKYLAGDAKSDFLQFRAYIPAGTEKPNITVIPYADIYATASYANSAGAVVSKRAFRGQETVLENPFKKEETETDQETYIYSVSQLKSIGDLSPFKPDTLDASNAVRLQELKVGDESLSYDNPRLTSLALGENKLLRKLDVRGCSGLSSSVNVQSCSNLEEIYFDRTSITGLELPSAGSLKVLHLPDTITQLWIRNQPLLTDLDIEGTQNVTSLWIENIPTSLIDVEEIITNMPEGAAVRLIGFNKNVSSIAEIEELYDKFDKMSGLDAQGEPTEEKAQVNGTIYIPEISWTKWDELTNRYPDISIIGLTRCTVTFKDSPETIFGVPQIVIKGQDAEDPGIPYKSPTADYRYTFKEWDQSFKNVQSDMVINALYNSIDQEYIINFDPQLEVQKEILSQTVNHKQLINRPEDPMPIETITGIKFDNWYTDPLTTNVFDFTTPVTSMYVQGEDDKPNPITLYGGWIDEDDPLIEITPIDYNKFKFVITDNVNLVSYSISTTEEEPTEWIPITPTKHYEGEFTIPRQGTYYVWGKNSAKVPRIGHQIVNSYSITSTLDKGTSLVLTDEETGNKVTSFSLQRSLISHIELDSHYEDLRIYKNDVKIENDYSFVILSDTNIKTLTAPKTYVIYFDMMNKGVQIPYQFIVYNNLVEKPSNQSYVDTAANIAYKTTGWYTDNQFNNQWNFDTDRVDQNTTLFTKWEIDESPSSIKMIPQAGVEYTFNWWQSTENGVKVIWDSTNEEEYATINATGYVSTTHTYDESKEVTVLFRCKLGTHRLGGGNADAPTISPSTEIEEVEFATNMSTTNPYAFYMASNLKHINLTDYMTTVAYAAFQGCSSVTELIIPDNIKTLENNCFRGLSGLTGKLEISKNITSIGDYTFMGCSGLSEIVIPEKIERVGESCFQDCTSLEKINISEHLKVLSKYMLVNTKLSSITIPETIEEIKEGALLGCNYLTKVIILNKNLIMDRRIFSKDNLLKTAGPIGSGCEIEFAWDVKIPDYAFSCGMYESAIESITLPETIKVIGKYAFEECDLISEIVLPSKLEEIQEGAFSSCSSLTQISVPDTCTKLGYRAFQSCGVLKTAKLYIRTTNSKINNYTNSWFLYCPGGGYVTVHIPTGWDLSMAKQQYGEFFYYLDDSRTITKFVADL